MDFSNMHLPPAEIVRHDAVMAESRRQSRTLQELQDRAEERRVQAERQTETLEALRQLGETQAAEAKVNAEREAQQQTFNRRMSWAAVLLAGAAIVVPFVVLFLDKVLR
jgi:regulator of protease activity HflC (stomatin/prohibitin superfamily)